MIRAIPWTWGSMGGATSGTISGQWVYPANARGMRVYPPRIRGDFWVENGHTESDNPALDGKES